MLRGIFMPAGVEQEQVDFYVDLFSKVRETPEWQDFMSKGAFNTTFMTGDEYKAWVAETAELHQNLMAEAGFLANHEPWAPGPALARSRSRIAPVPRRRARTSASCRLRIPRSRDAGHGRADRKPGPRDLPDHGPRRRRHPDGGRRDRDGGQLRAGRRLVADRAGVRLLPVLHRRSDLVLEHGYPADHLVHQEPRPHPVRRAGAVQARPPGPHSQHHLRAAIDYIGIYVAGGLFIACFMWWLGKYPLPKVVMVSVLVPLVLFLVFEVWFLVPLPKGPLEAFFGY